MAKKDWLIAFAPIDIVAVGGYVAVSHFKNRDATGDLDYLMDPQYKDDAELKTQLQEVIALVSEEEKLERNWMNDEVEIWATPAAVRQIFAEAFEQNIILFQGDSIRVWAAPFEWALERKMRIVAYPGRERDKRKVDMQDVLAIFKFLRDKRGPLDMEYFRNLNKNGFEQKPDVSHMEKIAAEYRKKYGEDLFSDPSSPAATHASTSYTPANYTTPSYATISYTTTGSASAPAGGSGTGEWSEWTWNMDRGCYSRYRKNNALPGGYEYEYDDIAMAASDKGKGKEKESYVGEGSTATTSHPSDYYYVKDKEYYYYKDGQTEKLTGCPANQWVWNEKGWKEGHGYKWRKFKGKGEKRVVEYE